MLKKITLALLDRVESYLCQFLLAFFVVILFLQIIMREFGTPLYWSEELARYSFVWFVFFGATYAARLGAHNRVTLQFKLFPKIVGDVAMLLTDAVWIVFNGVMVMKGIESIEVLIEFPYASPALDWQLSAVYVIFPLSFALMTIRILQVNYIKFILKQEIEDPDKVAVDESKKTFCCDTDCSVIPEKGSAQESKKAFCCGEG
jgi:TRAP-type C4-dicarboxylate transport system permease small subunit